MMGNDKNEASYPSAKLMKAINLTVDDLTFNDWLATSNLDAMVEGALEAAKAELKSGTAMPEDDDPRWALIVIDLGHGRAKPLVQALARQGIGRIEIQNWTYEVTFKGLAGARLRPGSAAQVRASIRTFAEVLIRKGFEMQIWVA